MRFPEETPSPASTLKLFRAETHAKPASVYGVMLGGIYVWHDSPSKSHDIQQARMS